MRGAAARDPGARIGASAHRLRAAKGGQEDGVPGTGDGRRAGATISPVYFSRRTQMRGIREDQSKVPRPGSGECGLPVPHPSVTLKVLEWCRAGALGHATVDKLRSQSGTRDRTGWAVAGPSLGRKRLVLFRGISAESSDLGQQAACSL